MNYKVFFFLLIQLLDFSKKTKTKTMANESSEFEDVGLSMLSINKNNRFASNSELKMNSKQNSNVTRASFVGEWLILFSFFFLRLFI